MFSATCQDGVRSYYTASVVYFVTRNSSSPITCQPSMYRSWLFSFHFFSSTLLSVFHHSGQPHKNYLKWWQFYLGLGHAYQYQLALSVNHSRVFKSSSSSTYYIDTLFTNSTRVTSATTIFLPTGQS